MGLDALEGRTDRLQLHVHHKLGIPRAVQVRPVALRIFLAMNCEQLPEQPWPSGPAHAGRERHRPIAQNLQI
jgi:hypothetical protein